MNIAAAEKLRIASLALVLKSVFAFGISYADGTLAFHLDFASADIQDVSGNDLPIVVGQGVSSVESGGPTLGSGTILDAGIWPGVEDDGGFLPSDIAEENQIWIQDNDTLDVIAITAGSIVAWVNPDEGDEWNNIMKTPCPPGEAEPCDAFSQFLGIEFQASGKHAGVFGAAQGWDTNVFSPDDVVSQSDDVRMTDTPTGEWTHTALTWNDQGDHTIFVNGIPGDTIIGVGGDGFGLNEPGDWTIGGDGLTTAQARGNPDPTRYLRGKLADVAIYAGELTEQEIQGIMEFGVAPATDNAPCDFTGNGTCDIADLNELMYVGLGSEDSKFDLNGSAGPIDSADLNEWLSLAGSENIGESYVRGDADLNGAVNAADLNVLGGNWQKTGLASWADGDFNGDGSANATDLNAIGGNWQQGVPAAAAVPEPASKTLVVWLLALPMLLRRNCR